MEQRTPNGWTIRVRPLNNRYVETAARQLRNEGIKLRSDTDLADNMDFVAQIGVEVLEKLADPQGNEPLAGMTAKLKRAWLKERSGLLDTIRSMAELQAKKEAEEWAVDLGN